MIEKLLPLPAAASEHFGDTPDGEGLFPQERALLAGVGAGRRREFTTVRHCARLALKELGVPPAPLLPDEEGAPGWPTGIVGSMTHCRGYRAAVVARRTAVRALGLDAEPHRPLREGVVSAVARPEERASLAGLDGTVCWDRLLFSAKEAAFKAWSPGARAGGIRPRSLHDIRVTLHPADGTFRAEILPDHPEATCLEGRWLASGDLLLTAVSVPASPAPSLSAGTNV
ncbi:4'-phosphopantetheinyl transferase [Streptomyces sp. NPDC050516]|uniref:4'-phosphopantetheinyl transferase n=1 Tax=Streptomyces sp. NPDC050516 TaxID=3365621 RepID=UPI0037B80C72